MITVDNCTAAINKDQKRFVAIVTDSVAQVPAKIIQELNITVVPFVVNMDGKSYQDGIDLVLPELYRRMRVEKIVPTTAAASVEKYKHVFKKLLNAGFQNILSVSVSGSLSSGFQNACLAAEQVQAEYPGRVIKVLDSRKAAFAQGFIAISAAHAATNGKTFSEVLEVARKAIQHTGLVATLETLEYLARGGRIGKAAYLLGSLVSIKPILVIDDDGIVTSISKVRTEARAFQAIVDYVARRININRCKKLFLAILEADAPQQARRLQEMVLRKFPSVEVFYTDFTAVMGVHTGPGVIGLCYYYE